MSVGDGQLCQWGYTYSRFEFEPLLSGPICCRKNLVEKMHVALKCRLPCLEAKVSGTTGACRCSKLETERLLSGPIRFSKNPVQKYACVPEMSASMFGGLRSAGPLGLQMSPTESCVHHE